MYKLNNTFKWQGTVCLEHKLIIDNDFIKSNNIERISAGELILIFNHYYGIDIGDYGLLDVIIDQKSPNLTINIKTLDQFRELQLRKLIS